ncbi:hypothetical protein NA57DRAFT_58046 [Rhizodiscina lignyota]|uniref:F-box domain-containing protein n=1 Tax=Rhizodiscina lignyota TaxID=1504668 RepID=A0A9P4ID30_9PEZI|nr:hypothetical protein NA57DRAFT_58046 [Rhizodiscina lignyota]
MAESEWKQFSSKLLSLPREIRDNIYSFATSTHTTIVLVEPHVFTHVLFESLPFPALLRVNRQVREEVLDTVFRETRATMLDAWDCRGVDSFKSMNSVPQPVLERIRFGEIALNTWSPVENDIGTPGFLLFMKVQDLTFSWLVCIEALLSYVTGVRELRILFNESTLGKEKLQKLQEHRIVRTTGTGSSNKNEIRFVKDGEDGDFKERSTGRLRTEGVWLRGDMFIFQRSDNPMTASATSNLLHSVSILDLIILDALLRPTRR